MKKFNIKAAFKNFINEIASWDREKKDSVLLIVTVFFAIIFIVLLRIPFFRSMVVSEPGEALEFIVSSILYVIIGLFVFFWILTKKMHLLIGKLDEAKLDFDDKLNFEGTDGIYKSVNEEMKKRKFIKDKITVDIIGYTLYSVQPKLLEWKKMNLLKNIELNICHLDPSFIENNPDYDRSWGLHLRMYLKSIRAFMDDNELYFKQNKVTINLFPYKCNPGVHGFKISNGSLFMSFANWEDGKIEQPTNSVFVHLKPDENSKMGQRMRILFRNSLRKSKSYLTSKTKTDKKDGTVN